MIWTDKLHSLHFFSSDLDVKTEQVSPDTVQVQCSNFYEQTSVSLSPTLDSSFSYVEGICDGQTCQAFFKNLDATTWDKYQVMVTETNKVEAAKIVTPLESFYDQFNEGTIKKNSSLLKKWYSLFIKTIVLFIAIQQRSYNVFFWRSIDVHYHNKLLSHRDPVFDCRINAA